MKILVIGGSYFYGRVFTMSACEKHELTLLNRGTYSMADYPVKEIVADRKDVLSVKNALANESFDAVIDFCAYNGDDVRSLVNCLNIRDDSVSVLYVLISTADVLKHSFDEIITDDSPYENADISGETGAYIKGKIEAEMALNQICDNEEKIKGVILRPTVIYGPYDYSGRFATYVQTVISNKTILDITDSDGSFDCIYIRDAVNAITDILKEYEDGITNLYQKAFTKMIITSDERCSYKIIFDIFEEELTKQKIEANKIHISVKEAEEKGLPLYFSPYDNESYRYDAAKYREFRKTINAEPFVSLKEGLGKTFRFFL